MAKRLAGKPVADALTEQLTTRVQKLTAAGITPTLAIVRVGAREDDLSYERGALKRCETVGIAVKQILFPQDVEEKQLVAAIQDINQDDNIHGCLLFRPLPKHLDESLICETLSPEKDVDCITSTSLATVFSGVGKGYPPCTAQAVVEMLDFYGYDVTGKRVTVVGRSLVVGKPLSMLLLGKNATVTTCHTRTIDLPATCRQAEILVVAAGKMGVVGAEHVSEHQVVIDVGIHWDETVNRLRGDVDDVAVEPVVAALSPVPGGVGGVTTSVLAGHVISAAEGRC